MPRLQDDFKNTSISLSSNSFGSSRKVSPSPPVQPAPLSPQQEPSLPSLHEPDFSLDVSQELSAPITRPHNPRPAHLLNASMQGGMSLASIREESRSYEDQVESDDAKTPVPQKFGMRSRFSSSRSSDEGEIGREPSPSRKADSNRSVSLEQQRSLGGTPNESPPTSTWFHYRSDWNKATDRCSFRRTHPSSLAPSHSTSSIRRGIGRCP